MDGRQCLVKTFIVLATCLPLCPGMPLSIWMKKRGVPKSPDTSPDVIEGIKSYMDSLKESERITGPKERIRHEVLVVLEVLEESEKGHTICKSFVSPVNIHEKVVKKLLKLLECNKGYSHMEIQRSWEGDGRMNQCCCQSDDFWNTRFASAASDLLEKSKTPKEKIGFQIPLENVVTIRKSVFSLKSNEKLITVVVSTFLGLVNMDTETEHIKG